MPDAICYRERAKECWELVDLMDDRKDENGLIELARTYEWQTECLEATTTLPQRNGFTDRE